MIVDCEYRVVYPSEGVGRYLQPGAEVGRELLDLVPASLRYGLRWALGCAAQTGCCVQVDGLPVELGGVRSAVTLRVQRMPELRPDVLLVSFD